MLQRGAKFHTFQFIGDDGEAAGKKIDASKMNDLDLKTALILLGDGKDKNGTGESRTMINARNRTQARIAKEAGD